MPQPEGDEPLVPAEEARSEPAEGTRQEKRSRKKKKEQERMPQHGKGLAQIYKDAVVKRTKPQGPPGS